MKRSEEFEASSKSTDLQKGAVESNGAPSQTVESRRTVSSDRGGFGVGRDFHGNALALCIEITDGKIPPEIQDLLKQNKGVHIPHPENTNFTGRTALIAELRSDLKLTRIKTLTGLGGRGKTQLALKYTYLYQDDYDIVWWLRSEQPSTLLGDYAQIAERLKLPGRDTGDLNIMAEVVRSFLDVCKYRWLLVFDNAQEPKDIKTYLPRSTRGNVIITSRNPNWGNLARSLLVTDFERPESVEFLLKRTNQEDRKAASDLAGALGDLPLALEQAGAYMEATGKPLKEYLSAFQKRRLEVLAKGLPSDYPGTVATTWDISFEAAKKDHPASSALLRLCSYLAPDNIPIELPVKGSGYLPDNLASVLEDEDGREAVLAVLRRYSLIERRGDNISIHRLVQEVLRFRLSSEGRKGWAGAAVQIVDDAFPFDSDDIRTWSDCSALLPHALAAAEHTVGLETAPEATSSLLNSAGIYLGSRGDFKEAKTAFEKVLSIYEKVYGKDAAHPDVARMHVNLGTVLRQKGDLDGAKTAFEKALSIFEEVYGKDAAHPDVARMHLNLGTVLRQKGDLDGAKTAFEKALSIFEAVYGEDAPHPSVARTHGNLGNVLSDKGDIDGAKLAYEKALSIFEAVYGKDAAHPDVALTHMNLGNVLSDKGDIDGAKLAFEKALSIFEEEKVYGKGAAHPSVAGTLMNLGSVLFQKGDIDGAETAYEKALSIYYEVYGHDAAHPSVAMTLMGIGNVLSDKSDLDGAETAYEKALSIYEKTYGQDSIHPDVALTHMNIGGVLFQKGDLDRAKTALEKALSIYEKVYGEDAPHPDVASTHMNLGNVLSDKGDIDGAKLAYEKALSIFDAVYGQDAAHPDGALTRMNLGSVLFQKGDIDGAETAYEKALEIFQKQLGDDHPYTTAVRNNLESLKRPM